jgi:hypothetical protein
MAAVVFKMAIHLVGVVVTTGQQKYACSVQQHDGDSKPAV